MAFSYLRLSAGCRSAFRLRLPSNAPARLVGPRHANVLSALATGVTIYLNKNTKLSFVTAFSPAAV